jgi:hypothetical protein
MKKPICVVFNCGGASVKQNPPGIPSYWDQFRRSSGSGAPVADQSELSVIWGVKAHIIRVEVTRE